MDISCEKCGEKMEKAPYKHPYISVCGKIIHNTLVDVYRCPKCKTEIEILPNDDDGYSAGAGLLSED